MDHTDVGLQAAVRALRDVMAPAVDPAHAQARDQLRLTIDYLEFVRQRIDHLYARELFELRHHLGLARSLHAIVGSSGLPRAGSLAEAIAEGEAALAANHAPAAVLRGAARALAAAASETVRASAGIEASARHAVEARVLEASQARIAFERAWYLPLGLDADAHEVKPLGEVLGGD